MDMDKQEAAFTLLAMRGAVASLPEEHQTAIKSLKAEVDDLLKPFREGTSDEKGIAGLAVTLIALEFASAD